MHYSNWLIDVKNRASLRNECKTPPNIDWINRGNVADMRNKNPQLNEKTSELTAAARLLKKGKKLSYVAEYLGLLRLIQLVCHFFLRGGACCVYFSPNRVGTGVTDSWSLQFPPRVKVEGEGVLRYQGDGQLTGLTLTTLS